MPSEVESDDDARDLADCRAPWIVMLAAGAGAFSGVGGLMLALESWLVVPGRTTLASTAFALEALLGVLLLAMAIQLLRMRVWTTLASAALSLAAALLILGWNLFALSRGLFSLLGFAVPGLCTLAAVLALAGLGAARRASSARRRLRDRGVSFGL
jgi:hypothetical protein